MKKPGFTPSRASREMPQQVLWDTPTTPITASQEYFIGRLPLAEMTKINYWSGAV